MPRPGWTDPRRLAGCAAPLLLALGVAVAAPSVRAAEPAAKAGIPADPLQSGKWADLAARYLGDAPIVFDDRVRIIVPGIVENQAQVPIAADARALSGVSRLVVIADNNPIEHVLTLRPGQAAAYVSFRMKVEQGTPMRVAALADDGKWHVGAVFLDAAGGGCSQPALARKDADWSATVGNTQARAWREVDGSARLRLRLRHPMDTGLAKDNTPAYFIERLEARGPGGEALAALELFEPVSEDPMLTLMLRPGAGAARVELEARDNNGGVFRSSVPLAVTQ